MSILPDWLIKRRVLNQRMIDPFVDHQVKDGCISYGLSSYGYDLRVSDEFKLIQTFSGVVDPKAIGTDYSGPASFEEIKTDRLVIPPNSFALSRSVECFRIPRDIVALCIGKSTYCRCGIVVNCSPLEPEWTGYVTLEISNTTPLPALIYANEGLAQVVFFQADSECATSYADRKGKYQDQTGVTLAKI